MVATGRLGGSLALPWDSDAEIAEEMLNSHVLKPTALHRRHGSRSSRAKSRDPVM